jgi:DNA-binding NtrC family response regulator
LTTLDIHAIVRSYLFVAAQEVAVMAVVVIADDDNAVRELIAQIVEDEGHTAVPLKDRHGVVATLSARNAAALVIELRWASLLTGLEVLKDVAAVDGLRSLPVLVCSGASDTLQEQEAWLREHGYDTLAKPFDLDDLLRWIHDHVGER